MAPVLISEASWRSRTAGGVLPAGTPSAERTGAPANCNDRSISGSSDSSPSPTVISSGASVSGPASARALISSPAWSAGRSARRRSKRCVTGRSRQRSGISIPTSSNASARSGGAAMRLATCLTRGGARSSEGRLSLSIMRATIGGASTTASNSNVVSGPSVIASCSRARRRASFGSIRPQSSRRLVASRSTVASASQRRVWGNPSSACSRSPASASRHPPAASASRRRRSSSASRNHAARLSVCVRAFEPSGGCVAPVTPAVSISTLSDSASSLRSASAHASLRCSGSASGVCGV